MSQEITQGELMDVDVEQIEPNLYNPNEMGDKAFEKLKEEYERVGYLQPVLVRPMPCRKVLENLEEGEKYTDKIEETDRCGECKGCESDSFEIVDGEHRWRAAKQKGLGKIKCVVKEMSDEDVRITTLNMNDIKGSDDPVQLAEVLGDLEETGNTANDLDELLYMDEEEIMQHEMLLEAPEQTEAPSEQETENPDDIEEEQTEEHEVNCPHCGGSVKIDKESLGNNE